MHTAGHRRMHRPTRIYNLFFTLKIDSIFFILLSLSLLLYFRLASFRILFHIIKQCNINMYAKFQVNPRYRRVDAYGNNVWPTHRPCASTTMAHGRPPNDIKWSFHYHFIIALKHIPNFIQTKLIKLWSVPEKLSIPASRSLPGPVSQLRLCEFGARREEEERGPPPPMVYPHPLET